MTPAARPDDGRERAYDLLIELPNGVDRVAEPHLRVA